LKSLRSCLACLVALLALSLTVGAGDAFARNAYVPNIKSSSVSVFDTATAPNSTVQTLPVAGSQPRAIAITPGGSTGYILDFANGKVRVLDTASNTLSPTPIEVGKFPTAIAITPDGKSAYVANFGDNDVSVIDTATNLPSPKKIEVGKEPASIAITPDGRLAYVANLDSSSVSVIETATNTVAKTITVQGSPDGLAVTPDGKSVYIGRLGAGSKTVSVIDVATNAVVGEPIEVGEEPNALAISPDGKSVYVANRGSSDVSVINTATNTTDPAPIKLGAGTEPIGISFTPDGRFAYIADSKTGDITQMITEFKVANRNTIKVGEVPEGVGIVPDQSPTASFTAAATTVTVGQPVSFDATASTDPDGKVASYGFDFGDGQAATVATPKTSHTFTAAGTYTVTLRTSDDENCSQSTIFTGQIAYCNATTPAATQRITVLAPPAPPTPPMPPAKPVLPTQQATAAPRVKVACPASAKPQGCSFELQAVSAKPSKHHKAKPQSAVARAKAKAGHSVVVVLRPKAAFAARLAGAKRILVKETVRAGGKKATRYVQLPVVRGA
jgi:YVTN family beta-propeller protein